MFHTVFRFGGSWVHRITKVNSKRPFHTLQLTRLKSDVKKTSAERLVKRTLENKSKGKYLKFRISGYRHNHV